MLFTLKKIVGGLLLPLPALLLLIGIGIALLWFSRFQRTGKLCVSLGWLLLTLLSLQPVADSLLKPIEDTYPTWRGEQPVNYVVVLGGGYTWNPEWAPSSNLINNSLPAPDGGHPPVAGESRFENDLYRRGGENEPRQHGGSRGESGGEPWRTSQRYHCARSAERYRRGSAGGEARHRRRALPAGHLGVTPSAGDDILSPCRPGSASRAGQSAGGDLAAQSVGAGHSFSSVADAQRPGRL